MPESAKRVAILQSNYIPWKGYFDLINMVDVFVFHDDLQYTKGDWRNRNLIKTASGTKWLTIPCGTDEKRLICEVELRDPAWQRDHWRRIVASYRQAPYFDSYAEFFEDLYLGHNWTNLSELNRHIIEHISRQWLHIATEFDDSRNYGLSSHKAERVLDLLEKVGATEYVSGPAAKDYLDAAGFEERGIDLTWMSYSGYPEYTQVHPPFEHRVSIIDLLFCVGPSAPDYMNSFS